MILDLATSSQLRAATIMGRLDRDRDEYDSADEETIVMKNPNSKGKGSIQATSSLRTAIKDEPLSRSATPLSASAKLKTNHSSSASTPRAKSELSDGDIKSEVEPSARASPPPSKKTRNSKKPPPRVAPLFDDLPDATDDANSDYTVIDSCIYQNKYLGFTEHAMECDCPEEWGEF